MATVDKIIDDGFHADGFVTFEPKQLKKKIQEYARLMCDQQKQIVLNATKDHLINKIDPKIISESIIILHYPKELQ